MREKTEGNPDCRRHSWWFPEPGDESMTCDKCGREIPLDEINDGVIAAVEKHEGKGKADKLRDAIKQALGA